MAPALDPPWKQDTAAGDAALRVAVGSLSTCSAQQLVCGKTSTLGMRNFEYRLSIAVAAGSNCKAQAALSWNHCRGHASRFEKALDIAFVAKLRARRHQRGGTGRDAIADRFR